MEEGAIVVADFNSEPQSETELPFLLGDFILILQTTEEWLYGESLSTRQAGWFDPNFCHKVCAPLLPPASNVAQQRKSILANIIQTEQIFSSSQKIFVDIVAKPLFLRDTPFKRQFLSDPALAICISLIQDIFNASTLFLTELTQAGSSNKMISESYVRFAPSIQLFAQFAAENTHALHSLKCMKKAINEFLNVNRLPDEMSMESSFIMPLRHFKKYVTNLEQYVQLFPVDDADFVTLVNALSQVGAQTDLVTSRLADEESNLQLLNLQNQFVGNATIFKQGRRLLKEGLLERVKVNNGSPDYKIYYGHLFNDCFMYSQRKSSPVSSSFKLHKVLDLSGVVAQIVESIEGVTIPNIFQFQSKADSSLEVAFRCQDESDRSSWVQVIQENALVDSAKKKPRGRGSVAMVTSLPGVDPSFLGPRAIRIYSFLQSEIPFANSLWEMFNVVIQPLINSSKGATLTVGSIPDEESVGRVQISSEKFTSAVSKFQTQQVTDLLQSADVQIFLRAAEGLSLSLQQFASTVEGQCKSASWSEQITVGTVFSSVSARSMYNQYKAYASGQPATSRMLKGVSFLSFCKEAEGILSGKLSEKIEFPCERVEFYASFLHDLLALTPPSHPDFKTLQEATDQLTKEAVEVAETIKSKANFEKLLEVQSSFVSVSMFGPDPFIQKLASFDRTFIKEGDLKKVCRKKNKTFRFWLFNDNLIYGSAVGSNTYSFHRSIDLSKCSVAEHKSNEFKYAFEIFGAEKSFIAIAPSQSLQTEWISQINKAIEALRPANAPALAVAPLWVPDAVADKCMVCQQGFSLFRRRHHCRKCGSLVCGDHSNKKMVLPHTGDNKKQRVCDYCFNGEPIPERSVIKEEEKPMEKPIPAKPTLDASPKPVPAASKPVSETAKPVDKSASPSPAARPPALPQRAQATPPPVTPSKPPVLPQTPAAEAPLSPRSIPPVAHTAVKPAPAAAPPPTPPKPTMNKPQSGAPAVPARTLPFPATPPAPVAPARALPPSAPKSDLPTVPRPPLPTTAPPPAPTPPPSAPPPPAVPAKAPPVPPKPTAPELPKRRVPPPPPSSTTAPPAVAAASPRPPPPPPQRTAAPTPEPEVSEVDDGLGRYRKLREIMPEGAVRQKMKLDGFADDSIEEFIRTGRIASALSNTDASVGGVALDLGSVSLRKAEEVAKPAPVRRASIFDEIQSGAPKLKAVQKEDERMKPATNAGAGGLLDTLAVEMFKRRVNIMEDDDSESDASGFSTDSDD